MCLQSCLNLLLANSQKKALKILLHHGRLVKNKALEIAEHFTLDKIDLKFIEEKLYA